MFYILNPMTMKRIMKKYYIFSVLVILVIAGCSGNLNNGLVAYYPFDGNANDESGNGNHGVEHNGVTYVAGISGQAAMFDGEDDFISIWSKDQINQNINTNEGTVCVWFNIAEEYPGNKSFIYQYYSGNGDRLYLNAIYTVTNSADLRMGVGNKHKLSYSINANAWNNAVLLWTSDGVMKLYINGMFANKEIFTNPGFQFSGHEQFYFGRGWDGNPAFYSGIIDDLPIYNRALSESEIQELYNDGKRE